MNICWTLALPSCGYNWIGIGSERVYMCCSWPSGYPCQLMGRGLDQVGKKLDDETLAGQKRTIKLRV